MKFIIVWYLISSGGYNSNQVVYSPPMPTVQDCQALAKTLPYEYSSGKQCVQLKVVILEGK